MILLSKVRKIRWWVSQWAERKWWNHYLKSKTPEDYLRWKKEYWQRFLSKCAIQIDVKARIYDAGCGPAGIYTILKNSTIVAVDPLLDSYTKLAHFDKSSYPGVEFICTRIEDYLSKVPFDVIICINAINHVEDIAKSLKMLNYNLNKDAFMVMSTDVHRNPYLKKLFQLIPGDILHPHQYDLADYEKMLKENNFVVDRKIVLKTGTIFDYYAFIVSKINKDIEVQG